MTIATAEAINAAKAALVILHDEHLPNEGAPRLAFAEHCAEVFRCLHDALLEATRARPMTTWHKGCEERRHG